jgi:hypothetical protein
MEASERWARALRRASRPRRGSLAAAGAMSVIGVLAFPKLVLSIRAATCAKEARN